MVARGVLERLGGAVYRRRVPVLVASAMVLAVSAALIVRGGRLAGSAIPTHTEAGRALALLQREFPARGEEGFAIVFGSDRLRARDPRFVAAMEDALAPLRADPRVRSIVTPEDPLAPFAAMLRGQGGRHSLVLVTVDGDERAAADAYAALAPRVRSPTLTIVKTGRLALFHDLEELLAVGLRRVELVALPAAFIVLLLVFRTIVAALLPLAVAALAVGGGLAAVYCLAHAMPVSHYAANIVSMVGIGVAIDYTLFLVSRFREHLAAGTGDAAVEEAVVRAVATAGRAVLFSGVTVAIGMAGLLFFHGIAIDTIGIAGAIVVALAVLSALTFLPALLGVLGRRIDRGRVLPPERFGGGDGWHRLAFAVTRRPVLALVPTLGLLALLMSPFFRLQVATSSVTALPPTAEARVGADLIAREFPGYDANRVIVVASFPGGDPLAPAHLAALRDAADRIEALPEVDSVVGPGAEIPDEVARLPAAQRDALAREVVSPHAALLFVSARPGATSSERAAIVRGIRAGRDLDGGTLFVTGPTALELDHRTYVKRRAPLAIAFVVTTMYVVLFALLGSVVLPLKAVLMNVVSLTASFGALVWIFQEGHLHRLLGFTPAPIDTVLPVLLFCLAFGLSMDYEVFLLSRVQEEYRRGGDSTRAVAEGLARSGRLITGAAAIMVVVFASFALAQVVPVKAVGLGLAIAVALDATVVRLLVVPASMRLLGGLNWWVPRPLVRVVRGLHLGEVPTW